MEVATAVAAQDFQLTVDRFHGVGGRERTANRFRKAEEGQIVWAFLAQFGDKAAGGLSEAITEFFELLLSELETPTGFNGAPALLKLAGIGFAEMSFGIALHVHGTKLHIAVGEQTLGDGQKPGKIIVHDDEHPP